MKKRKEILSWVLVVVMLLTGLPVSRVSGESAATPAPMQPPLSDECSKLIKRVDALLCKYLGAELQNGHKTDEQLLTEVNKLSAAKIQKIVDQLSDSSFAALAKEAKAIEKAAKKLSSSESSRVLKRGVFPAVRKAIAAANATPKPAAKPLKVSLSTKDAYPVIGEKPLSVSVKIEGGVPPYTVKGSGDVESVSATQVKGDTTLTCKPTAWGKKSLRVVVTDAAGATAEAKLAFVAIQREKETAKTWQASVDHVKLTGIWGDDIIEIAKSQLEYRESAKDFVLDKSGAEQHYSRYGAWYGSPYSDWCAMFIAFCAKYAGIPLEYYPTHANVSQLARMMQSAGAYREDLTTYLPQKGDVIFFVHVKTGKFKHVALVERVSNGMVHTIEGNVNHSVCRRSYPLGDAGIIAYASMDALMQAYWSIKPEAVVDLTAPREGAKLTLYHRSGETAKALVNLREEPDENSVRVIRIEKVGTKVTVKGEVEVDDVLWYAVDKGEYSGFIRGDLVRVIETALAEPDGLTAMGAEVAQGLASWGIPAATCVEVARWLENGDQLQTTWTIQP